ncbi:hypothetical protein pdul_cds_251 [Pandoravirus dulcis]|uniref:DUF5898 domain-containing protein n=1 Tax=Pandoravirus dulcis TaxID=1349409 RepID=S4VPI2_9VIRU|nr:hypothetical protein pdul_cds_251 [Pandoravirus dulcis]AGO82213.1 hypothetical protein pdul_cds_251 [Pandoravirus dulcis]
MLPSGPAEAAAATLSEPVCISPVARPSLDATATAAIRRRLLQAQTGDATARVLATLTAILRERQPGGGVRAFHGADGLFAVHDDAIGLGLETRRAASHGSRLVDGPRDRFYAGVVLVRANADDHGSDNDDRRNNNGGGGRSTDLGKSIFDWLMVLRAYRGVATPVVVVVAADTWRLFWLADAMPLAVGGVGHTRYPPDGNGQQVRCTHAYDHSDEGLARLLARVFDGMATALVPFTYAPAAPTVATASLLACVDPSGVSWVSPDDSDHNSNNDRDASDAVSDDHFLLVTYLGSGLDGRAWRCRSRSNAWHARDCVLKFGHTDRDDHTAGHVGTSSMPRRLQREMHLWRSVWGVDETRVLRLAGRPALLMPFAQPIAAVARGASGHVDAPTRTEVARAIGRMAAHGLCHDDLAWRHVGRIQRADGRKQVVLFDLARVRAMPPADAVVAMCDQLGLD